MNESINDIERRRPVWEALSELFVDTELQDSDYRYMARVLAESGYDDEELHDILHREVFPICIPSLMSPVGVWPGFSLEWLEERILSNVGQKPSLLRQFMGKPALSLIEPDWRKVLVLLPEARHISGNPYRPYLAPAEWPPGIVGLAEAFRDGQNCGFALHDALLEAGHPQLAEHFVREQEHPQACWVLTLILNRR